jgi:hypothetical protein
VVVSLGAGDITKLAAELIALADDSSCRQQIERY